MNIYKALPSWLRCCPCLNLSHEEKLFMKGYYLYETRIDLVTFLQQWDVVKSNMMKIRKTWKRPKKIEN